MTVANQTRRTSAIGSAAAGQEIPFSFPITDSSDLTVKTRVTATGVTATLTETSDYTVTISGDTGGIVTLVDALAATSEVFVIRNTPRTQSFDLEQGGAFNAENVEDAHDKNCKLANDNAGDISLALRAPDTDATDIDMELPNSVDRASSFLKFDANGEPTAVDSQIEDTYDVSAFMQTVIDDASAAIARATLGVAIGSDVQAYSAYLLAIAALAVTDGNIIVGNGTTWVAESGATARTSLGAAVAADVVNITEAVCYENAIVCYENEIVTYA
jgi:hypothetical protein